MKDLFCSISQDTLAGEPSLWPLLPDSAWDSLDYRITYRNVQTQARRGNWRTSSPQGLRGNVLKSSGNQNSTEACSAFHIILNAYIYTQQSITCMWHLGLEHKASSADLCKLMRQTDGVAPCDTVSCFRCHCLDSTRFLTQILGNCVSKSGSQWEMLFLVKEAILEGDFCCGLRDTIWIAQQTDSTA